MSDFGAVATASRAGQDDVSPSTYKSTLTASGSTHTKGSWTQLSASAPFDVSFIVFELQGDSGARTYLFDIGVGGAGSEVVLVPNVFFKQGFYNASCWAIVPVSIAAGTRISARVQSGTASAALNIKCQFIAGSFIGLNSMPVAVDYGTATGSSAGTTLTAGTGSAKGAWAQLTASSTYDIRGILLCMSYASIAADADCAIDIGVGGAGSEVVVLGNVYTIFYNSVNSMLPCFLFVPLTIPAGTRISARFSCTSSSNTMSLSIVGFS